jgi:two-component system, chemotaxis family, CheB/CheR fusion protein
VAALLCDSPGSSRSWVELHFRFLERFAPPSVIVGGNYDIIHLSEHAGRYLQLAGGTSTLNLLRIVHPMLRTELRAALFRAKQIGVQVIVSGLPLEMEGAHKTIDLRVSPAQDLAPDFLLVVFDAKEEAVPSETFSARSVEPLMQQLAEGSEPHQKRPAEPDGFDQHRHHFCGLGAAY